MEQAVTAQDLGIGISEAYSLASPHPHYSMTIKTWAEGLRWWPIAFQCKWVELALVRELGSPCLLAKKRKH